MSLVETSSESSLGESKPTKTPKYTFHEGNKKLDETNHSNSNGKSRGHDNTAMDAEEIA